MTALEDRFLEALHHVTLAELARGTSLARPTWEAYKYGNRRITQGGAQKLVQYLRKRSEALNEAAERLEAAAEKEINHE